MIFTGDQACFKCRNCNKKIETLKYARTSRGIFCMNCHESLMERRRRKALARSKQREQKPARSLLNPQDPLSKAFPALSPEAISNAMTLSSTSHDTDLAASMNFF